MMSAYDNVVTGKLRLKGQALDVKGGIKKKKPLKSFHYGHQSLQVSTGGDAIDRFDDEEKGNGGVLGHLTAAERRYMEQVERIEAKRLSEHYDIPKVGPG